MEIYVAQPVKRDKANINELKQCIVSVQSLVGTAQIVGWRGTA